MEMLLWLLGSLLLVVLAACYRKKIFDGVGGDVDNAWVWGLVCGIAVWWPLIVLAGVLVLIIAFPIRQFTRWREKRGRPLLNGKHCLFSETLVRMADGTAKAIKNIEPGEYVLGSGQVGRLRTTRVRVEDVAGQQTSEGG